MDLKNEVTVAVAAHGVGDGGGQKMSERGEEADYARLWFLL